MVRRYLWTGPDAHCSLSASRLCRIWIRRALLQINQVGGIPFVLGCILAAPSLPDIIIAVPPVPRPPPIPRPAPLFPTRTHARTHMPRRRLEHFTAASNGPVELVCLRSVQYTEYSGRMRPLPVWTQEGEFPSHYA